MPGVLCYYRTGKSKRGPGPTGKPRTRRDSNRGTLARPRALVAVSEISSLFHFTTPIDRGGPLWALNALPGFLAGVHLANLLFFLNPDLPFSVGTVTQAALVYGALLGTFSSLLLTPLTWGRGRRAQRLLPWLITFVLAAVAIADWVYASRFSYFLPPGIIRRMIKAALWLTLTSLIAFYTALLHTVQRRPYGWRSRYGLLVLAVASIYVMAERREAFKPSVPPVPRSSAVEPGQRPKLLVVGLGGGSLDAVLPLARQGRLPFFSRLLEEGVYARPKSLTPVRGEALWTTLATSRLPYKHGIVSDTVYHASFLGGGIRFGLLPNFSVWPFWRALHHPRLVDASFRRTLAIWDVLERLEFPSGVMGWPVTDPVSPSNAYAFSHRYFQGYFHAPMAQPRELAERGVLFQIDPEEIDPALLDDLGNRAPYPYLQALAGDLWRESLTMFMLDQQPGTRAVFLMLPGLAQVSRRNFGGFAAVQFSGIQREPYVEAAHLVTTYYRHLDQFLGQLWARESGATILAVVSAYGFEAPEGWRKLWAQLTGGPTRGRSQRAPDGLFLMLGDGVRAGEFLEGVELVDIMPTLLYALGFPIARDLDGQVLTGAFSGAFLARHPLTVVPSYETLILQEGIVLSPVSGQ